MIKVNFIGNRCFVIMNGGKCRVYKRSGYCNFDYYFYSKIIK